MFKNDIHISKTNLLTALLIIMVGVALGFACNTDSASAAVKKPGKTTIQKAVAGQNTVSLKWSAAKGAKGYRIYRNGKMIKQNKGKKTTSFVDRGLATGMKYTYKVRAYKTYKQKVWYNKKTKKWQKKKPKKAYRGKSKRITKYRLGAASPARTVKTKGKAAPKSPQPTTDTPTTGSLSFPEIKTVTLSYGNTTIHLGQKWNQDVKDKLTHGASGVETIVRKNFIYKSQENSNGMVTASAVYDETVCMIDINDYDNFLTVYIANGQIISWVTTRSVFGKNGTKTFNRGDTSVPAYGISTFSNLIKKINYVQKNGVLFGGFQCETIYTSSSWTRNIANEKRVGLHFINAYRYLAGAKKLSYDRYLDGETMVWSGTYHGPGWDDVYTNTRFGAQPWAETMNASGKLTHCDYMTSGPLATSGKKTESLITIMDLITDGRLFGSGENCGKGGQSGETCLINYEDSSGHLSQILYEEHDCIGIGMSGRYHCEAFGTLGSLR